MSNTAEKVETKAAEEETEAVEADVCCANCGIAEVDDIKLEECNGCDLVKYCRDECQKNHREQHEEECKNRKALLRDKRLFTQPDESHRGECPLCFLPLPLDPRKSMFWTCCSEVICMGCVFANYKSNGYDEAKAKKCPFCREPAADDDEEEHKRETERVKANDPAALRRMGGKCYKEGDKEGAFEYWTKAADLGDLDAHYDLGIMYKNGEGVEEDKEKMVYHYEKAAIGGHPIARYNLAAIEGRNGNAGRSAKHYIIAANLGDERSMKTLWAMFKKGDITKEDLNATLRTHQAALDGMKSEQRNYADYMQQKYGYDLQI
jgi:hypothetical protein